MKICESNIIKSELYLKHYYDTQLISHKYLVIETKYITLLL